MEKEQHSRQDLSAYDVSIDLFTAINRLQQFKTHAKQGRSKVIIDQIGQMDVQADADRCLKLLKRIYGEFMKKAFPKMDSEEGDDSFKGQRDKEQ